MTVRNIVEQAKRLSPSEQVELYEALADLIGPSDASAVELTPAQEADLDMRIAEIRSGKAKLSPGDEVFARLRQRP
jgi:putative addiction module component (TIGR02574 family)